ncbi:hypothetical protein AB0D60_02955 [Streptomyces sp. NPDC048306]|uniref:hypothetical protein n=1 Tax=Streptomyces sp. NPDC048306 TaxID=3154502 RepID=UPI0033C34804
MADTEAPPAPAAVEPETPVQAPAEPSEPQPTPTPEPDDDQVDDEPQPRARRRRGVPIEPLVIGATNSTAMAATAAYQAAGPVGLAAAAGGAVVLAAGGALQRRRTVRRRTTTGAGRARSGGALNRGRGRGGAGALGSGRGAASGRGGAAGRGGAPRSGGTGRAPSAGRGGGAPRLSGRTRQGALGTLLGRGAGRIKTPRPGGGQGGGKHRRPGARSSSPSAAPRTPRRGGLLGRVRPAASAARRGMAGAGRAVRAAGRTLAHTARRAGRTARRIAAPAAALWRNTVQARRAIARRTGKAASALVHGALAGIAGVAAAVWGASFRAGLDTLRAVWQRLRRRRAARKAANGPAMTGPAVANTPAPVATSVRRPATAGGSPSTTGAQSMSGHHFLAPAMELERIASTYKPDGMMQVGRDFAALPDALEHVANAMRITTARADQEQPLDPRIVELMQNIYNLQMKASELARELAPAFRQLHAVDIERLQNPRKGVHAEAEWDVRANIDTSL